MFYKLINIKINDATDMPFISGCITDENHNRATFKVPFDAGTGDICQEEEAIYYLALKIAILNTALERDEADDLGVDVFEDLQDYIHEAKEAGKF